MANFCMYCGRPLKEGEVCHCQEEAPEFEAEYPGFAQEDNYSQEDENYYYEGEDSSEDGSYYASQNEEEYPEDNKYYYGEAEEESQEDDGYYTSQTEEELSEDDGYYTSQNGEEPSEDEEYYTSQEEEESSEDDGYYYGQEEEQSTEDEEYYTSQNEEESSEDDGYYYGREEEQSSEDEEYYTSQEEEESSEDDGYYYGQEEEQSSEDEEYYYSQEEEESPENGSYYSSQPEERPEDGEYYYNQEDVREEDYQSRENDFYYEHEPEQDSMRDNEDFTEGTDREQEREKRDSSRNKKDKQKEKKSREKSRKAKKPQEEKGNKEAGRAQENTLGEAAGLFETLHMVSTKIGNALDAVYNFVTPTDKPGRIINTVDGRKLLGLSKEDKVAQVEDCYERGLQIVPDLIQPCGQEIPIRQYDICATRSLLKGTWQEGRLQVTNKRVLFRLSGRNWIGKMQKSVEFALDDVTGIDIRNGNRLSFVALFLNVYYAAFFASIGNLLTQYLELLAVILGIAGALGISILLRKHYYAKLAVFSFAFAPMNMWAQSDERIRRVVGILVLLGFVLYFILASIRPNFSFKILTKSGGVSPIEEKRVDTVLTMLFNYFIARGMDVLPGKDAERAMDEVGTMIMDIQKFGDFGIQKWKMD